jgi:hypothetical protein
MINTLAMGGMFALSRILALGIIGAITGWKRYD